MDIKRKIWLISLKAGDKVKIKGTGPLEDWSLDSVISKVTDNYFVVDGDYFNRITGFKRGNKKGNIIYLSFPS